jgi:transcriptional regulator
VYRPTHFTEDRLEPQHDLIRQNPLGLLIRSGAAGLAADPVPFVLDAAAGRRGTLKCHVARSNTVWRELGTDADCLVVFQGPQAYVSPSHYPSKREHGRVVPTWNYATVHVWGRAIVREDAGWLRAQIGALTQAQERGLAAPWSVSDAPKPFIDAQLRGIVGIEIEIARIEGKWKVSQNRSAADRAGVATGLRNGSENARRIAELVGEGGGTT